MPHTELPNIPVTGRPPEAETIPVVIYHARCLDGFLSAWCFWRRFGERCEFVPAAHGESAPDLTDRDVYIVDFCYPREELLDLAVRARRVTVLDHHVSTLRDLSRTPSDSTLSFWLDLDRSGSGLAWDALFPHATRPTLIDAMDDHDTGRHRRPDAEALIARLALAEFKFPAYEAIVEMAQNEHARALHEGELLIEREVTDARRMLDYARWFNIGEACVPVVGCPPWIATRIASEMRHLHE